MTDISTFIPTGGLFYEEPTTISATDPGKPKATMIAVKSLKKNIKPLPYSTISVTDPKPSVKSWKQQNLKPLNLNATKMI
jgi:hypothetical protein